MFYSTDLITTLAKRLAMLAHDHVSDLANAVVNGSNDTPEITGAVLGVVPHLVEKAIITNAVLPGDVSLKIASEFVKEYEALLKIVSNAGGFSSPIKKALFNAGFHTIFSREYGEIKPKFNTLWEMGREERADPIDYLAYGLLKRCESSGLSLDHESNVAASVNAVHALFAAVHEMLKRA